MSNDTDTTVGVTDQILDFIEGRFFGKYRGIVQSNEDETGRGRLQVTVPAVMGDQAVWALPCVPYAGPNVGLFAQPPDGAGVWVEFEAGDPFYPIWVGCFWGEGQIAREDSRPQIKFLKTDSFSLRIDDQEGTLEVTDGGGSTVKITATEISVEATEITNKAGTKKTSLTPIHFDVNDGAHTVV